jgi:UDP-N-acetylmuramate--alanine ligase
MEFTGKKIHFIGIGGIGMSALAQMFKHDGAEVSGSDRDPSPNVHDMLAAQGIVVTLGHRPENVPNDAALVVYSDAVVEGSEGFVERLRARELGIDELSYFKALGRVSAGKRTIAVAGTHGKTTTTGMLGKILVDADTSPTVIVGSIVKDFGLNHPEGMVGRTGEVSQPVLGSNYVHGDSDIFVVEACEYRDHLLELSPQVLVITNLEWDHTDWFLSLAAMQETFKKAIMRVPENGTIVTDPHNPNIAPLLSAARARVVDYTAEPAYALHLPGEFNASNARAAAAAARAIVPDIPDAAIAASLAGFHGTWRRFEYKGKTANGADVYDDYAHHPTAVQVTIKALCEKTKGKVYVAFHPHLYSRTRDLLDGFAAAFAGADKVFIAPIYAAREVDDGTTSSGILAERIRATGVDATALDSFDAIEKALREAGPGDAIMTMGAGDIYKVADALAKK